MMQDDLKKLPEQMRGMLEEYVAIESRHAPAINDTSEQDADMTRAELF